MNPKRTLQLWLAINAVAMLAALIPAVMPWSWIDASHRALGMGPFPAAPVAEYLARGLSILYVVMGGFTWLMARDVVRYRAFVVYLAFAFPIGSTLVMLASVRSGLPWWWVAGEPVTGVAFCAITLVLVQRARLTVGQPG